MALPQSVILCECWARDGLQSMPQQVSTEHKLEMIHRIVASGVRKLEVTSFSHPKLLPQFADSVEVLDQASWIHRTNASARMSFSLSRNAEAFASSA